MDRTEVFVTFEMKNYLILSFHCKRNQRFTMCLVRVVSGMAGRNGYRVLSSCDSEKYANTESKWHIQIVIIEKFM